MRMILCPRCGAPIATYRFLRPAIKPFCARCSWNLERAEAAVGQRGAAMKLIPVVIIGAALLLALATARNASLFGLVVPLLVGAILVIPFWSYFSAGKEIAAAKLSANPALAMAEPLVDPEVQRLQALARPRRVRFRIPRGLGVILVILVLIPVGAIYLMSQHPAAAHGHVNVSGFFAIPIIFVVLLVIPYFRDKRNAPLLRDGELALGRVTYQENIQVGKSSYSRIAYEFKSTSGQLIEDRAKDLTYSVYEDMTIPVFYDPANPSRNITPCATYLRIDENPF